MTTLPGQNKVCYARKINGSVGIATILFDRNGARTCLLEEPPGAPQAHPFEPLPAEEALINHLRANGGGLDQLPRINLDNGFMDGDICSWIDMAEHFSDRLHLLTRQMRGDTLMTEAGLKRVKNILEMAQEVHTLARADAQNARKIRDIPIVNSMLEEVAEDSWVWFNSENEGPFQTNEVARWVAQNPPAAERFHLWGGLTYGEFLAAQGRRRELTMVPADTELAAEKASGGLVRRVASLILALITFRLGGLFAAHAATRRAGVT